MSVILDIQKWGDSHRPGILEVVRIVLGVYLTYKGLYFITHLNELKITASGINAFFADASLAHYVVFAHILGGPLLAVGLFTRIVSLIQIPILAGAVFFVNAEHGLLSISEHQEFWISVGVFSGLVLMVVFGAGKFSIDHKRLKATPSQP